MIKGFRSGCCSGAGIGRVDGVCGTDWTISRNPSLSNQCSGFLDEGIQEWGVSWEELFDAEKMNLILHMSGESLWPIRVWNDGNRCRSGQTLIATVSKWRKDASRMESYFR